MKKSIKILSVFLAVLTFFSILSAATPVFAANVNEYIADKEYTEKLLTEVVENDTEEKAPIVKEVEEKRDEYQKVYLREDGTYTAVISKTPVHYEKDGEWVDIVNDLKTNGDVITNTAGNFNVEFPKQISEDNEIKVENGKESLTFSIVETEKSNGKVKNNKKQKQDKNKVSDEEIFNNDISRTVSEIEYEDVLENTNLEYVVTPTGVKENIIVENKESLKKSYSFNITKGDLKAELDKSNNLYFKNSKGEIVFTIPAPVMTDSNGAISYDIDVKVKNLKKETITLTYTPDKKWLNAKDRAYPVAIDPVIMLDSDKEFIIEDSNIGISADDEEVAAGNGKDGFIALLFNNSNLKSDLLVKFNNNLVNIYKQPNIVVTNASYIANGGAFNGNIIARAINGSWDASTICGSQVYPELVGSNADPVITYDEEILDYYTGAPVETGESKPICFNITNLFNEWLSGERANNGFALTVDSEEAQALLISSGYFSYKEKKTYYYSYCTIDYIEASGYNSNYEYVSQNVGRAGTFNVNTFTRALSGYREDISLTGNRMPVSVGFNYNSSYSSFYEWYQNFASIYGENVAVKSPYGENWTPNYLRALITLDESQYYYFTENGSMAVFNATEDEDGNRIFEVDSKSETGFELGFVDSTKSENYENLVITTSNGDKEYFDSNGWLTEICEEDSNNKITLEYEEQTTTDETIFYLPKIACITDGSGRKYDFSYVNDMLVNINCFTANNEQIYAGTTNTALKVLYSYNSGDLVSVIYPDNESVAYTYDDNNLKKAKNIDNYNFQFNYDDCNKVVEISEYANTTPGNNIELSNLSVFQTKIIDAYNGTNIYQFNKSGELQYTFDGKGNYCKSDYAKSNDENVYENNNWKIRSENLLKNGSFETVSNSKAVDWNDSFPVIDIDDSTEYCDYICKISSETIINQLQSQAVFVNGGKNYTFSIFAKNSESSLSDTDKLYIRITAIDKDGNETTNSRQISPTDQFEQYSVSILTEFEIAEIIVEFGLKNKSGNFYINNAQLESGSGTANFNFVENGSFNNTVEKWAGTGFSVVDETINGESVKALKLPKCMPYFDVISEDEAYLYDKVSSATQTVTINGKKDEVYSIGAWFKGDFTDGLLSETVKNYFETDYTPNATRIAQIKATYTYTDENGASVTEDFAVDFIKGINGWQYVNDSFVLKGNVSAINITVIIQNLGNDSFLSNIELTKNETATVVSSEEVEIESPTLVASPLVASSCPCTNCEKTNCGCACTSEEVCECVLCIRGTENTTDENGNIVSRVKNDGDSTISTEMTYSDDGNYLETAKYDGSVISTFSQNPQYSTTSPLQVSVNGQTSNFTYNAGEHLDSVTKTVSGLSSGNQMKVEYDYDNDKIVGVNHNNYSYSFEYDDWGNIAREKVNNQTIVNYMYGANQYNKQLQKEVYENGQEVYYKYDSNGNINKIKYSSDTDWRFTYDYSNSLVTTVQDNVLNLTKEISWNDYKILDSNSNIIYSKTDSEEFYDNATYNFTKSDDVYNETAGTTLQKITVSGIDNSSKSIDISKLVDWFERDPENIVSVNKSDSTVSVERIYDYKSGQEPNATTEYIEKVSNIVKKDGTVNSNHELAYTYDSNGNMKTVSKCENNVTTMQYEYYYDEANQLVRVDDYINDITTTYQYDMGGNIVLTKNYNRTTYSSTSTPTSQEIYSYDSSWKDKLISVNGKTLTYDIIGNLLTYNGKIHTWIAGRKLATFTNDNCSISFTYDENGLRSQKSVTQNGTTKTYKYTWMDGKLVGQSDGINTLRFIYDENDEVVGFVNNDSTVYLYMKNILGDIISIVDENGLVVVNYEYDAWGKVISITGSLADTIGILNPIRYRSYYYDTESSYYYLNSRYYDPELKRFINADKLKSLYAPKTTYLYADSANVFAYCANSPVRMVDYSGEKQRDNPSSYIANAIIFSLLLLGYENYFGIYPDAKYSDGNYLYKYSKKGAIAISLFRAFDDRNSKLVFSNFLNAFYAVLGFKVFDAVATFALDKFKKEFPDIHNDIYVDYKTKKRPFLFNNKCVSKEIEQHCFVYWMITGNSIDYTRYSALYLMKLIAGNYIESSTQVIEILEQDAYKNRDSLLFNYYAGIADYYKKTDADPYWNGVYRAPDYVSYYCMVNPIPAKPTKWRR